MKYSEENGLLFHEVSAKENIGVDELFKKIAEKLPKESLKNDKKKKLTTVRDNPLIET